MSKTAVAHAANEVVQKAASDALAVQDAVNLIAIVGSFHRHLLALQQANVFGDDLNNHPVSTTAQVGTFPQETVRSTAEPSGHHFDSQAVFGQFLPGPPNVYM